MSWSCDVCGAGVYEDHAACKRTRAVEAAAEETAEAARSLEERVDALVTLLERIVPILEKMVNGK